MRPNPVEFLKFQQEHILYIVPDTMDIDEYHQLLTPQVRDILNNSVSFSAWVSGRCIGAAGLIYQWKGRAEAWMVACKRGSPFALHMVRKMREVLDTQQDLRRIEFVVYNSNTKGHKLAKMLGFGEPQILRAYSPKGEDATLYTRIRTCG